MDLEIFIRFLDRYGAELEKWPEEHRLAATALLERSAEARRRWQMAGRLDALLARDRERFDALLSADPERITRITAASLRRIRSLPQGSIDWRSFLTKPFGAALAATLVLGFAAGFLLAPASPGSSREQLPVIDLLVGDDMTELEVLP